MIIAAKLMQKYTYYKTHLNINILEKMRRKMRYTPKEVAEYLDINTEDYLKAENFPVDNLEFHIKEKLAALYHVSEYDLLTGAAVPHSFSGNVYRGTSHRYHHQDSQFARLHILQAHALGFACRSVFTLILHRWLAYRRMVASELRVKIPNSIHVL